MDKLISDHAQSEISNRVLDILRAYCIDDWQSEPHHQHQNFAERRYQTIKRLVNTIMDRTGAPPSTWLLCLKYVCYLLNHISSPTLEDKTPIEAATGERPDISALLQYTFYQPVYFKEPDTNFPSESPERKGYWVGIAEHCGDALTYLVLTDKTSKIIPRSGLRPAHKKAPNVRADPDIGEEDSKPIRFIKDRHDISMSDSPLPTISADDLIGRTFLLPPNEQGERYRARISRKILDDGEREDPVADNIKFLLKIDGPEADQIIGYNYVLDQLNTHLENDLNDDGEQLWQFKQITAHQGPLKADDANYKGSPWNVLVEWETGETTYEPLHVIAKDDPATCAAYARQNNLLDLPGWKRFKKLAKTEKRMLREINQTKLRQVRRATKYKFGYEVPRDYKDALRIDAENGNTLFQDAVKLELAQIDEYKTFIDKGKAKLDRKGRVLNPPGPDFQKIRCHLVFDVKHDGRRKARLVADGHLTETPVESVYSGVVSFRSLRLVSFLSVLNTLELWGADVGNAYLEATIKEKLYIVAGEEFGDRQGHILVIHRALYGCKSSGKRWHERFSDVLRSEGFTPSKSDPDTVLPIELLPPEVIRFTKIDPRSLYDHFNNLGARYHQLYLENMTLKEEVSNLHQDIGNLNRSVQRMETETANQTKILAKIAEELKFRNHKQTSHQSNETKEDGNVTLFSVVMKTWRSNDSIKDQFARYFIDQCLKAYEIC